MKRNAVGLATAVALTAAAAGCGEDDDADTSRAGTTTPPAEVSVPEGVARQYAALEREVREAGGEKRTGDWRVAYIVEDAEGWFEHRRGRLVWRAPARNETTHIEILPIDAASGRLVPDVPITLEVLDGDGRRVARKRLRLYHAEFFHYAENFALPRSGRYRLRAIIGAPRVRRHGDRSDPPALSRGATVTFRDVEID